MPVPVVVVLLLTCVVIVTSHNVVNDPARLPSRIKREKEDKRSFTTAEKEMLLELHNMYRSEEQASDMRLMEWDNDLEKIAQDYADKCVWTHNDFRNSGDLKFDYIGENLYAYTRIPTALDIVKDWADEKEYYDYDSGRCSKVCGHYTQVVWAQSYALGCGIRFCSNIQNLNWERYNGGYIVVCNYGPGGNILGRSPYSSDKPVCSECTPEFPYCVQGLCSKTKRVVSPSSSSSLHYEGIRYVLLVALLCLWMS